MRTLYLLLLLLAAMLAAVTVLNWEAFVSPTELSLGFASVSLPLGLTLLSLLVLLTVIFLVHAVYLQGTVLLDTRRHSKELQANRELADKAEASRFTELRGVLEALHARDKEEVMARLDVLEAHLVQRAQESDNSTAAYVGQLEQQVHQINR